MLFNVSLNIGLFTHIIDFSLLKMHMTNIVKIAFDRTPVTRKL